MILFLKNIHNLIKILQAKRMLRLANLIARHPTLLYPNIACTSVRNVPLNFLSKEIDIKVFDLKGEELDIRIALQFENMILNQVFGGISSQSLRKES